MSTANVDFDVGERLRQLRVEAGLSQRQVAELAGMTHATIANAEGNKASPSVATLSKILDVYNVTFAGFFHEERPSMEKIFYREQELVDLMKGPLWLRQVGPGRHSSAKLQVLKTVYKPGADTGSDMLQHDAEEGGIIIAGSIELTVGDRREVLHAGDAYLFRSTTPHRFRNVGDTDCVIVCACTPPYL